MSDEISRGEFDLLRQIVAANQARLEGIDQGGTRGVGVVQAQLVDVVKDLAELKADVNSRFDAHQRVHDQDQRDRAAQRRWAITTAIAVLVLLAAILGLQVSVHLH